MRKLFLILALAGFSTMLQAGPITPEKALKVAERVLAAQPVTKAGSGLQIIWDGESAVTKAHAEDPAFYVVARDGGGFVIVAGNDNVRPVLALSYTNSFQVENMPCNVSAWMERIKRYSRGSQEATPEVRTQWEAFEETKSGRYPDAAITGVFFPNNTPTVEWNQWEPANLLMPTVPTENERSVCGCVPLAVAEIMTWFGYPAKGTGTVASYVTNSGTDQALTISAHELTTNYNWVGLQSLRTNEQFREQCSNGDTTDLGWNAAHLLYDVGTLIQVNYGSEGTGGNENRIASQFSEHMGYSRSVVKRSLSYGYPAWKWDQLLVEQVNEHPVYYGGYDPNSGGGHAYVLDGYGFYNGDVVFHFNFGWSGYCNGYYSSDYQAPEDERRPKTDFGEYHYIDALFDFVPDSTSQTSFLYELSFTAKGLRINSSGYNRSVQADELTNTGNVAFSGTLSLFHVDKNGLRDTSPISSGNINNLGILYYGDYSFSLNGSSSGLALGDKYAFYYRPTGGEYKQVLGLAASSAITEVPVYPAAFIKTEASYAKDDYFYFRLTNHDYTYSDAVWTIKDKDGVVTTCPQSEERFKLTKTGKYTIKVTPVEGGETLVAVINVN